MACRRPRPQPRRRRALPSGGRRRLSSRMCDATDANAGANDVGHCARERLRACAHSHHIQPCLCTHPVRYKPVHSRTCATDIRLFAGSAAESDAATLGLDAHARADRNACATESAAKCDVTGPDWSRLDWTGLDWTGLDRPDRLDWTRLASVHVSAHNGTQALTCA